jgi:hypothetical protein
VLSNGLRRGAFSGGSLIDGVLVRPWSCFVKFDR